MFLSTESSQFFEFVQNLLSVSDWPARWNCGKWSDFHGWLYILSDTMIWLAYFVIPVIIFWFIQKQPKVPFLPIFGYFAVFIVMCGLTHLLDAIIFWWPAYRLSALIRFFTAIISMMTLFALIKGLPQILNLNVKNDEDSLVDEIQLLKDELEAKNRKIDDMREELKRRLRK